MGNIRLNSFDQPNVFDFDFAGTGWRMYDIALYANAFGLGCSKEGIEKRERRKEAFCMAIRRFNPFQMRCCSQ